MKGTPEQDGGPAGCPFTGFQASKFHPMNRKFMKLKNYQNGQEFVDTLCNQALEVGEGCIVVVENLAAVMPTSVL